MRPFGGAAGCAGEVGVVSMGLGVEAAIGAPRLPSLDGGPQGPPCSAEKEYKRVTVDIRNFSLSLKIAVYTTVYLSALF